MAETPAQVVHPHNVPSEIPSVMEVLLGAAVGCYQGISVRGGTQDRLF